MKIVIVLLNIVFALNCFAKSIGANGKKFSVKMGPEFLRNDKLWGEPDALEIATYIHKKNKGTIIVNYLSVIQDKSTVKGSSSDTDTWSDAKVLERMMQLSCPDGSKCSIGTYGSFPGYCEPIKKGSTISVIVKSRPDRVVASITRYDKTCADALDASLLSQVQSFRLLE